MKLDDILAITGKPGLFKLVSATRQGVLVESLLDGKRMPASNRTDISALKDIAIYTQTEELPLAEVFDKIYALEDGGLALDPKGKSNEELMEYMAKVLPDFDQSRVYPSHLKKLFSWYNLLHEKSLLLPTEEAASESEETESGAEEAAPEKDQD